MIMEEITSWIFLRRSFVEAIYVVFLVPEEYTVC